MAGGMRLVLNVSKWALPLTARWSRDKRVRLTDLQRRAHLTERDPGTLLMPLDDKERLELDRLELETQASKMPKWGIVEYPFAAYPNPGCLWNMPYNHAALLSKQHAPRPELGDEGNVLVLVNGDDPRIPKGMKAVERNWLPSSEDMSPMAGPQTKDEDVPRFVVRDEGAVQRVVESGWTVKA